MPFSFSDFQQVLDKQLAGKGRHHEKETHQLLPDGEQVLELARDRQIHPREPRHSVQRRPETEAGRFEEDFQQQLDQLHPERQRQEERRVQHHAQRAQPIFKAKIRGLRFLLKLKFFSIGSNE